MRESAENAAVRWEKLRLLQQHFPQFATFLRAALKELGYSPTWMQYDIANFLQFGGDDIMVEAQRGEAKSTITAIFAVWCLIHDPKHRILVVSAGETQANEVAGLIQRLIMTMDILECLRPDKSSGDRTAVEAFDVHHSLRGIDKSPSVACIGITGNLQGKRADLLIADDIESTKNSRTAANREWLMTMSREFSAICTGRPGVPARIVYLGTPQSSESIYNSLPGRGFTVRIWPGRYPTPAQLKNYGPHLAPSLRNRLEEDPSLAFGGGPMGDQGQPTDPTMKNEDQLTAIENKEGPSYFQLQYMLNTALMDSLRFPLKPENIVLLPGSAQGRFPLTITRAYTTDSRRTVSTSGKAYMLSTAHEVSSETAPLQGRHMQIDPAGGGENGDETGFAITGFLNSTVYGLGVGGVPGGYSIESMQKLAELAEKFNPNVITIEKNMGHGAFAKVFLPILREKWKGTLREEFVTGQKETRIIGTLEPIIARGSFVVLESFIEMDDEYTEMHNTTGKRALYSVMHQLTKITRQRGCLKHDDRLDALEGSVRHWVSQLAIDQDKAIEKQQQKEFQDWLKDPLGRASNGMGLARAPHHQRSSVIDRYRR